MILDKMKFLEEEIIIKTSDDIHFTPDVDAAFHDSNMRHEKDSYSIYEVVKVGENQFKVEVGQKVLINNNGLNKEITILGYGVIKGHYAIMNHQRIFSILDE